jgi:hypothetical protein
MVPSVEEGKDTLALHTFSVVVLQYEMIEGRLRTVAEIKVEE